MNALQGYSSDEYSDDENKSRGPQVMSTKMGDQGTNYDDVGMDISESSGDEGGGGGCDGTSVRSRESRREEVRVNGSASQQDRNNSSLHRRQSYGCESSQRINTEARSSPLSDGKQDTGRGSTGDAVVDHDEHDRTHSRKRIEGQRGMEVVRQSSREERLSGSPREGAAGSGDRPPRRSRSPAHRTSSNRARSSRSKSPRDSNQTKNDRNRGDNRNRRSRSRDRRRRSRSRERRSRSRERRDYDRRRRSRSRDRGFRRDYRRDSKEGLLPLPKPSLPPLLATPPVPALPSYYNPNSVSALKYAEQERKKKLLWGNKGGSSGESSSNSLGSMSNFVTNPRTAQPPPLMSLSRSTPASASGRTLNLGLGKDQYGAVGSKDSSSPPDEGKRVSMADLWSSTTFNNDADGKMAEKFKRLMGVKEAAATQNSANTPGAKLSEKQQDMFNNMEKQYEVARQATHTHKGFGLGFSSSSFVHK